MVLGIYGASGLGTEFFGLADLINEEENRWDDIVFIDDDPEKQGQTLSDAPIFNFEQVIEKYGIDGIELILAIGEPIVKSKIFEKVCARNIEVTDLLHPTVSERVDKVKGLKKGKGIVVHKNSGFPPYSTIGNNVLIQGTTAMGHGIVLGDNVVISSFAFVGGDTKIGKNTYIGPSSCIRNGLNIGENVIVGMGSVVTKDIPDNVVVYGNPAKIVRNNDSGRVFSK